MCVVGTGVLNLAGDVRARCRRDMRENRFGWYAVAYTCTSEDEDDYDALGVSFSRE